MRPRAGYGIALATCLAAACAGGRPSAPPADPSAASAVAGSQSTSDDASGVRATGDVAPLALGVGGAPTAPAAPGGPAVEAMPPIVATALGPDLEALGLDPLDLPPIEKIDPKALRGVMKLIARSLRVRCGDCHEEGDFAAPTPRKKVAARMWDEYVTKLALTGDGALFCDSCHEGKARPLVRTDMRALSQWMQENYVAKVKRKDGEAMACETCHVDMAMRFLNKWGGLSRVEQPAASARVPGPLAASLAHTSSRPGKPTSRD